jgi:hypothetical protein
MQAQGTKASARPVRQAPVYFTTAIPELPQVHLQAVVLPHTSSTEISEPRSNKANLLTSAVMPGWGQAPGSQTPVVLHSSAVLLQP